MGDTVDLSEMLGIPNCSITKNVDFDISNTSRTIRTASGDTLVRAPAGQYIGQFTLNGVNCTLGAKLGNGVAGEVYKLTNPPNCCVKIMPNHDSNGSDITELNIREGIIQHILYKKGSELNLQVTPKVFSTCLSANRSNTYIIMETGATTLSTFISQRNRNEEDKNAVTLTDILQIIAVNLHMIRGTLFNHCDFHAGNILFDSNTYNSVISRESLTESSTESITTSWPDKLRCVKFIDFGRSCIGYGGRFFSDPPHGYGPVTYNILRDLVHLATYLGYTGFDNTYENLRNKQPFLNTLCFILDVQQGRGGRGNPLSNKLNEYLQTLGDAADQHPQTRGQGKIPWFRVITLFNDPNLPNFKTPHLIYLYTQRLLWLRKFSNDSKNKVLKDKAFIACYAERIIYKLLYKDKEEPIYPLRLTDSINSLGALNDYGRDSAKITDGFLKKVMSHLLLTLDRGILDYNGIDLPGYVTKGEYMYVGPPPFNGQSFFIVGAAAAAAAAAVQHRPSDSAAMLGLPAPAKGGARMRKYRKSKKANKRKTNGRKTIKHH